MNHKKLTVCIPVLNQFELAESVINLMIANITKPEEVEFLIYDNASTENFKKYFEDRNPNLPVLLNFVRLEKNVGNYPIFMMASLGVKTPITAFFHSDLLIHQKGWDERVIKTFEDHSDLGLAGFIGSTDLDHFGGRGMGTCSNFQGVTHQKWRGSKAEVHGRREEVITLHGSVVDGCAMIFRTDVLKAMYFDTDFPPHHFYDRIFSILTLEQGFKVAILGIPCDHISGQTANQESSWHETAKAWAKEHLNIDVPEDYVNLDKAWFVNSMNPSNGHIPHGFDHVIYLEAERRFLQKYRDTLHLMPRQYGNRTA